MQPLGPWKVLAKVEGIESQRAWLQSPFSFSAWASGRFSAELVRPVPLVQSPEVGVLQRRERWISSRQLLFPTAVLGGSTNLAARTNVCRPENRPPANSQ